MSATQTLAVEKILIRHKFTEAEATEILDYVENQKGDFATKQDIALVKQGNRKRKTKHIYAQVDSRLRFYYRFWWPTYNYALST